MIFNMEHSTALFNAWEAMMKTLTLLISAAALTAMPATANAQLFGGFDNNTLLGSTIGAGLGGAIGSNLAGSGVRDEGTAIGAVLGGLAGAAYGNSRSQFAGNPYAGSFNPGFNGRSLIGSGIGATLGGAIGSNLAGSGNRQEGTAIGAVLGGLAGYGLSNARSNQRYGQAWGGQNYGGQGYTGGYAPASYGPQFGAPQFAAPQFAPQFSGPQFVPSGQYVTSDYIPNVSYPAPVMQAPTLPAPAPIVRAPQPQQIHYTQNISVAAPNVRLAGPTLQRPDIHRGLTRVETMPIARAQRIVLPAAVQTSSRYTISEPYTLSEPTVQPYQAAPQFQTAPSRATLSGYGGHTTSAYHSGGNAVHITEPSTGSGHYHGQYTGKTYCYADSAKRYTAQGAEIVPNCSRH